MNRTATITCSYCGEGVTLNFQRVYTSTKEHWEGTCTRCGERNYIYRPSWDLPVFQKHRREYLMEVTGYSGAYLCRIANGKAPLGQVFIDRCCSALKEPREALFTIQPEAKDVTANSLHTERKGS